MKAKEYYASLQLQEQEWMIGYEEWLNSTNTSSSTETLSAVVQYSTAIPLQQWQHLPQQGSVMILTSPQEYYPQVS